MRLVQFIGFIISVAFSCSTNVVRVSSIYKTKLTQNLDKTKSHSTSPDTVRHLKSNSLYETVSQFDQNTCNGQLSYYSSNPSEISALKTGCASNQPVAGNSIMLEVVSSTSYPSLPSVVKEPSSPFVVIT